MHRVAVLLLVAALPILAQTITSSIVGTVTDPSGAIVPGVKVTVTNLGTGVQSSTVTDGFGNYTIGQLPPGNYQIDAEMAGFKKFVRQNINLEMTRQLRIDMTLETGAVTETVNVEATTPLLETETGQLSTTIENRQVRTCLSPHALSSRGISPASWVRRSGRMLWAVPAQPYPDPRAGGGVPGVLGQGLYVQNTAMPQA